MVKEVWFNLPVNDLAKSREFFRAIGFKINPRFENSEDMVSVFVGENNINIMLFPKKTFQSFIQTEITDSKQSNEILISFDAESIAEVRCAWHRRRICARRGCRADRHGVPVLPGSETHAVSSPSVTHGQCR